MSNKIRICPKCKVDLVHIPEAQDQTARPLFENGNDIPKNIKLTVSRVYRCPKCNKIEVTEMETIDYYPKLK